MTERSCHAVNNQQESDRARVFDREGAGRRGEHARRGDVKDVADRAWASADHTPRDRAGTFEPQLVRKRQRRFEGFDEKILALYARGMSTRDIEAHLRELYGAQVGRNVISRVTDAVTEDVRAWPARPLEDVYPVVFLDALVLKIRDGGSVVQGVLPGDGDRNGRITRGARPVVRATRHTGTPTGSSCHRG
jgi:transposase-like protein